MVEVFTIFKSGMFLQPARVVQNVLNACIRRFQFGLV